MGRAAKGSSHIDVLQIPPRSPDLNPLDFSFWAEVNTRMRKQEARFSSDYVEPRAVFVDRLRRTVLGAPASKLVHMVGNVKRRCMQVVGWFRAYDITLRVLRGARWRIKGSAGDV